MTKCIKTPTKEIVLLLIVKWTKSISCHIIEQRNAMPKEVGKAVNTAMDKAVKQIDEKISEIKMLYCITLFLKGIIAMIVLMLK